MKIKVITSYKPGTWESFARRGIHSMAEQFPPEVDVFLYCEEQQPIDVDSRITCVDLIQAEPELFKFKDKHKDDPTANGKIKQIEGGVRRSLNLQGLDKNNDSFLWDAVRFANKVFCVINAVRNSNEYDYVLWIDADTFTFRPVPTDFFTGLLPKETMLTYLGREDPTVGTGGIYPECGFVGYNLAHPETQNFINDWEQLYITGDVFKILEWHDSYVFWHLSKIYRAEKNILVNDIGYHKGVKGHHVFINSELGLYMDHFKGNRKLEGKSKLKDFRDQKLEATKGIKDLDYWKKI